MQILNRVDTIPRSTRLSDHFKMNLATFAKEAVADFYTVGAVAPSSRYLTQAMLRPLPLARARVVAQLGPGTGAMTQALLNLIPFDAALLTFEINSCFSRHLKLHVSDSHCEDCVSSHNTGSNQSKTGSKMLGRLM